MHWRNAIFLGGILGVAATVHAQTGSIYAYQWESGGITSTLDQSESNMRTWTAPNGTVPYASAGLSFPIYSLVGTAGSWHFNMDLDYRPYGGLATSPPTTEMSGDGDAISATPNFKQFVKTWQPPPARPCPGEGDPCVISNGNQFQSEYEFTWGKISFSRYYNSVRLTRPYAAIDYAWSASFSQRVITQVLTPGHGLPASPTAQYIVVQNEQAHPEFFRLVTAGTSTTPGVFRSTVTPGKVLVAKTIQTTPTPAYQWIVYYPDGHREYYDHDGRITTIQYPDDPRKTLTVTYVLASTTDTTKQDYWIPDHVADGNDRRIYFEYTLFSGDPYRHLTRIKAYELDSFGAAYVNMVTFDYDVDAASGSRRLRKVNRGDGTIREYKYGETTNLAPNSPSMPYQLTGVIDENGVRFADLLYDDHGRASASYEGGSALQAGAVMAAYTNDGKIVVSRSSGQTVSYDFRNTATDQTFRSPSTRTHTGATLPNGPGFSESWVHGYEDTTCATADERLCRHTDEHGVVTEYQYDDLFERVRIEGKGTSEQRRIETDYDRTTYRVSERRVYGLGSGGSYVLQTKASFVYSPTGQLVAKCEIDPQDSSVGSYQCSATVAPPQTTKGVRRWVYTYCVGRDSTTNWGCPAAGYLWKVADPRGYVTQYFYYVFARGPGGNCQGLLPYQDTCNNVGDLHAIEDASGRRTTWVNYHFSGQPKTIQDDNSTYTMFQYDGRQRLVSKKVGVHEAGLRFTYDNVGNVKTITDSDNVVTTYTYDAAHRLTDVADATGGRIHFTLDAMGNRTKEETYDSSNTLKRKLSRTYDLLDRLWTVSDADNHATVYGYDNRNDVSLTTDANGIDAHQTWDGLNRLKSSIQNYVRQSSAQTPTQNVTTRYQYDASDNLVQVTDPQNLVTQYNYDGLGNLRSLQSPDTGLASYAYDAAGNRVAQTDARNVQALYEYDPSGRFKGISYPSNPTLNIGYVYDQPYTVTGCPAYSMSLGRLTQITDSSGSTTYCYDYFGNVIGKRQATAGKTFATTYSYTDARRLASVTYPGGAIVTFGYDAAGRANTITYKANSTATAQTIVSGVAYLPFGPAGTVTFGDGHTLGKSHDRNYAVTGVASSKSTGFQASYLRSPTGDVSSVQQDGVTWTYGYDLIYRLASGMLATGTGSLSPGLADPFSGGGSSPGAATSWSMTYSATGDRVQLVTNYRSGNQCSVQTDTYAYVTGHHWLGSIVGDLATGTCPTQGLDASGATLASTTTAYANDANGNITSRGDGRTYAYDARNRLASVTLGTTVHAYLINGRGERVGKQQKVNSAVVAATYYVYDEDGRLLGEYDANGATIQEYVYLNGEPVAVLRGGSAFYVETDQLGTPRVVLEPGSGFRMWSWDLLVQPFGAAAATSYTPPGGQALTLNLRFPGQYYDVETGLHYNYFRDYEPATGRYIKSDPSGLVGGINTYIYAMHAPFKFLDPLGLEIICIDNWDNDYYETRSPNTREIGNIIKQFTIFGPPIPEFSVPSPKDPRDLEPIDGIGFYVNFYQVTIERFDKYREYFLNQRGRRYCYDYGDCQNGPVRIDESKISRLLGGFWRLEDSRTESFTRLIATLHFVSFPF